jgi:predicted regulator of Ras-like GTPase activity (Roadblock/LC7/MglB family)
MTSKPARLADLLAATRRLALVGLAKNTGKTETLAAILAEHAAAGRRVGVTSIGRDGEERDVIDGRIIKPRIRLVAGSLVATTDALLRASTIPHERLLRTGVRTPLGEVVVGELHEQGTIEVAGPSAAADVRVVSEAMARLGAEQVLIDGAIDRRAASSPTVADGLVMATGAVLSEDIEQVVALTAAAVELVRLPEARPPTGEHEEPMVLPRRLVLSGEPPEIAVLLRAHPQASTLVVDGALGGRFLQGLLSARRERAGRELRIVVGDPTKVFLSGRAPGWYRRQGIAIEVLRTIELKAITVNPVAPQAHHFDSERLRALIEEAVGDVPVFDVLDPNYRAVEIASR